MAILEKIIDWRTEQIKQGLNPKQITLSPWDEKALAEEVKGLVNRGVLLDEATEEAHRIFGLDIISTPK